MSTSLKEFLENTFGISLNESSPISNPPPLIPLTRQIGESKWQYSGQMFIQNPALLELEVAKHMSGWRYMLYRSDDKDVLIRRIFYGTNLSEELRWNIVTEIVPGLPYPK